ncbi:MAG: PTS system mannose/fructose/sorbose family transporter subunit IID [bacterium]|nr:PTS system mannose/fructose/sorbose family transporter subunit IID [bacterium]
MSPERIPKRTILFRSLALQLFLNYKTMQGAGYLFALRPALRDPDHLDKKAHAAGSFINGHPAFSSAALGALVTRLKTVSSADDVQEITNWKRELSTPLGAIGDSLIWERLKPVVLALVVSAVLVAGNLVADVWVYAAIGALVVYNGALWLFRDWAFGQGVWLGERLTELALHPSLAGLKRVLRYAGILSAATVLAASIGRVGDLGTLGGAQFAAGFAIMMGAALLRSSTLTAALLSVLAAMGIGYLFHTTITVLP